MQIQILVLLACVVIYGAQGKDKKDAHGCSIVKIPMCIEMPYNATRMPNLLQHGTQDEAAIMAHEFLPLVDIGCSEHVRFFVCSVFAPMCTETIPFGVPACRSVCHSVKAKCLPVLEKLNFTWPSFLRCNIFPKDGLCMMPPNLTPHLGSIHEVTNIVTRKPSWNFSHILSNLPHHQSCSGPRVWVPIDDHNGLCSPLCGHDFMFKSSEKRLATIWSASWAFICLVSTSFSLLTFCLDAKRFNYPERPVICLAFSYFFYCIPFLLRLTYSSSTLSCDVESSTGLAHLATSGSSGGCVASFIFQYYFGFASELWWTILTICWFLSAAQFWGSESLRSLSTYFHLVAWGVPGIASVLAIIYKQIDGDELSGLCFLGNLRPLTLLYFVIIPQAILFFLGIIFILAGFAGLFRIRNTIRNQVSLVEPSVSMLSSQPTSGSVYSSSVATSIPKLDSPSNACSHIDKLERLMLRLGIYTALSTIPAAFVLAFRLYIYFNYEQWLAEVTSMNSSSCNNNGCSRPRTVLFLFCLFMSLVLGVTSGIWVWSTKTFTIWKKTLSTLCNGSKFQKQSQTNRSVLHQRANNHPLNTASGTYVQPSNNWGHNSTTSTTRTSYTSSRHHLLRNSASSFV